MPACDALEAWQGGEVAAARAMALTGASGVTAPYPYAVRCGVDIRPELLPRDGNRTPATRIVYMDCPGRTFQDAGPSYRRDVPLAVEYGNRRVEEGCHIKIIVEDTVVLMVRSFEPIHEARTRDYLLLAGRAAALLLNVGSSHFRDGVRRYLP